MQALIRARMDEFARVGGGVMIDRDAQDPSTWHALGGVPMGGAGVALFHGKAHKGTRTTPRFFV
ncbi:hypothetical protein DMH08_13800 [Actinomadura sp. WAC 06369]|nr:hypothetical protein DMH08_13800 [Actinomadura sp. WAC 06369]